MKAIIHRIQKAYMEDIKKHQKTPVDYAFSIFNLVSLIMAIKCEEVDDIDTEKKPFLFVGNESKRIYVFIESNKYFCVRCPFNISYKDGNVLVYKRGSDIKITNKDFVGWEKLLNSLSDNGSLVGLVNNYDNTLFTDTLLDLYETIQHTEPGYIRYDDDLKASIGREFIHPAQHFDINMSKEATYKFGLYDRISCSQFIDYIESDRIRPFVGLPCLSGLPNELH